MNTDPLTMTHAPVLNYGHDSRGWRWRRAIGFGLAVVSTMMIGLVVLTGFVFPYNRLISLRYPRSVTRPMLTAPVPVAFATGDTLTLQDGRVFHLDYVDDDRGSLQTPNSPVDIDVNGASVTIYGDVPQWLCGPRWAALIELPIFADDVPTTRRRMIALATPVTARPTTLPPAIDSTP